MAENFTICERNPKNLREIKKKWRFSMVPLEEIFCFIDDFCKCFQQHHQSRLIPNSNRKRNKRIHSITHGNGQKVCFWIFENKGNYSGCVPKIAVLP